MALNPLIVRLLEWLFGKKASRYDSGYYVDPLRVGSKLPLRKLDLTPAPVKPPGKWIWAIPIIGLLYWLFKKKPKPPGPGPSPGDKPPVYSKRVGVGSLMWIGWPAKHGITAEAALARISDAGLTGIRAFLCRHGDSLIPWGKGADGKYHVVRGDVIWSQQHVDLVRQFLGWCKRYGIIVTLDAYDWCSMREDSQEDWGGHPLNKNLSNSGINDQFDFFNLRRFDITALYLERIRKLIEGYESIVEFTMMNEPPWSKSSVRAWEREGLKHAKNLGIERRVTSSEGDYARDLLKEGLVYAIQWHGIEDTGRMNKGMGQAHIYDTDGAENKGKIDYGALARKAIHDDVHFHALVVGVTASVVNFKWGALEACSEAMKEWWVNHPRR